MSRVKCLINLLIKCKLGKLIFSLSDNVANQYLSFTGDIHYSQGAKAWLILHILFCSTTTC